MSVAFRLLLAIAPLLLTVLFGWLVMDAYLNFGSGERDIFLIVPPLIWSLVYLCCYLVLWWRRSAIGRLVGLSAGVATGVVLIAWFVLIGVVLVVSF
jgi:hypothetical protein